MMCFIFHAVTSKHFVMKIRKSEQRRNRRLTQSHSDSNLLEIYRHKCFRFRRNSGDSHTRIHDMLQDNQGSVHVVCLIIVIIIMIKWKGPIWEFYNLLTVLQTVSSM